MGCNFQFYSRIHFLPIHYHISVDRQLVYLPPRTYIFRKTRRYIKYRKKNKCKIGVQVFVSITVYFACSLVCSENVVGYSVLEFSPEFKTFARCVTEFHPVSSSHSGEIKVINFLEWSSTQKPYPLVAVPMG